MNYSILGKDICRSEFGVKAYWINWLYKEGYKVPKSIFFSYNTEKSFLQQNLIKIFNENNIVLNKYAIRSSSTTEDSFIESKAGIFKSYLGEMTFDNILENYENVKNSQIIDPDGNMGVIIQELVDPLISGIIFSSNPQNFSKNEVIISYTNGLAEKLVSGKSSSIDLIATIENNDTITLNIEDVHYKQHILKLVKAVKQIEEKLSFPVDIEWAINTNGELVFLQCRPITGFLLENSSISLVTEKEIELIPTNLTSSDKILLRLLCEKNNVFISRAYLLIINCGSKKRIIPSLENIQRSEFCRGYSVVVISPKRIEQKIMRAFVGNKKNFSKFIKCHRYGVRAMSDYENLESCIDQFIMLIEKNYWACSVIIQEIFDPIYTGIIKKIQNNFIIELAKGHFVSKGIVPMSRYIIENRKIVFADEVEQEKYISIIEGCTLEYYCGYESRYKNKIVSLSENELLLLIDEFKQVCEENAMIEFGILENYGRIKPYLIDIIKEDIIIDVNDIKKGVLYHGKLSGKIVRLKSENTDSLNLHYLNEINTINRSDENIIFIAKLPDISYLRLLSEFDPKNIGFIFEKGSVLCHFSILLRERKIPSLIGYDISKLKEGEIFELNI